jgi:hypothetical protein
MGELDENLTQNACNGNLRDSLSCSEHLAAQVWIGSKGEELKVSITSPLILQ